MPERTPSQQAALEVLQQHGTVFVSNATEGGEKARVYWQTARWLRNQGYARESGMGDTITITTKGRDA